MPPDARWAVDSDRGVTYSATQPEGSRIVAGQWWAPDYHGPQQLVSFDADLAHAFGIGLGDTVTVNVLGRDIEAKIRLAAPDRMADAVDQLRVRLLARP